MKRILHTALFICATVTGFSALALEGETIEELRAVQLYSQDALIDMINANTHLEKVVADYAGKEFSQFKKYLGELAASKLSPISLEMNKLMKDEKYLDSIICNGKDQAINVADPILSKIYEIIGFFRD